MSIEQPHLASPEGAAARARRRVDPQPEAADNSLSGLVARVVLRDQAAFKQLYDTTSHCLFGIILRLLRERSWAEEVLQEAYVSIWNTASGYSALKAQPMTWLMTVARYKALDALRSTRVERQHLLRPLPTADEDDDSGPPDVADERCGPLEQLVQAVESSQLRQCLQALESPQRQAISLAFYDGLTHTELAAHMQQPLGTVKAWVRRGLERLKPCLERCAVEPKHAP